MPNQFVHLRLHSEYSISDGLIRVNSVVSDAAENNMPAVAITDQNNIYSLVKFFKAATQSGIKPILGADLWVEGRQGNDLSILCCLVKNLQGYRNLVEIISEAYLTNQLRGTPVVKRAWLKEKSEGLIILSGALDGEIGKALVAEDEPLARSLLQEWQENFKDHFYLELHRTGKEHENEYIEAAVSLAQESNCPIVATNNVRFDYREDFEAHEARVCIGEGVTLDDPRRPRRYTEEQYFKSSVEMCALFDDLPEALENSVLIAKRCSMELELGKSYLPEYPVPEGMTIEEFFAEKSREGLEKRFEKLFDSVPEDFTEIHARYFERLDFELEIINQMGFPGYFLIVADFIGWSKQNDIPVGPGRGSGAGSLVAYALEITDLDPLKYDLLFERFLNPERVSMPDFDVDFCMDGRDRVIEYVAQTYGKQAVSQIITFGTMAAKAVVRDVARVQGKPYGLADNLSKMIPFEVGITLEKAMEQEKSMREFVERDDEASEIMEMAYKLEGVVRNVGKHAGGVVIAPGKLTNFSALYCDEEGNNLVTQFDKKDVEAAGLVKFDFLGLRTLTIIDWALKTINKRRVEENLEPIDIAEIPLDDRETFEMLKRAETTAVFQLESSGMKDLIKRLQPDVFEEIIALVALFRPGPLQSGMVDDFIDIKHGRKTPAYPLPQLEGVLENTYGVILYQEQVMKIAQVLAGFSLGEADMLRRAMGYKDKGVMDQQRELFNKGAAKNNIDVDKATEVFDLMEHFAGYGFNKSHSAAYALVSYQTAWLKCHYPAEFMAAVLSADMDNTDKVVTLIDECHSIGLKTLPPDINTCEYKFTVNNDGAVVYGLGAIKGLGEGPTESIVDSRAEAAYKSLFNFCTRVDMRKVNRRSMEALMRCGAFDNSGPNKNFHDRSTLLASLDDAIHAAEQEAKNEAAGMSDLFGDLNEGKEESLINYTIIRPWSDEERLNGEKDTLGLYLTGHPIDQYENEVANFISNRIVNLKPAGRGINSVVAGLILELRVIQTKRGSKMVQAVLDDKSGRLDMTVFSEAYDEYRDILQKGKLLVVEGDLSNDHFTGNLKLTVRKAMSIEDARDHFAKSMILSLDEGSFEENMHSVVGENLKSMLTPYRQGHCKFAVHYRKPNAEGLIRFGDQWKLHPSQELVEKLQDTFGKQAVKIVY